MSAHVSLGLRAYSVYSDKVIVRRGNCVLVSTSIFTFLHLHESDIKEAKKYWYFLSIDKFISIWNDTEKKLVVLA